MKITLDGKELSLLDAIQIALDDKQTIRCLLHEPNGEKFFVRLSDGKRIEVDHNFRDGLFASFFASLQSGAPFISPKIKHGA